MLSLYTRIGIVRVFIAYYWRPSMCTFVELMSTGNKRVLRKLAAYIFHVLKIRDVNPLV